MADGIRIDDLNPTVIPSLQHEFAAMKDGLTVKLSIDQVRGLIAAIYDPEGVNADAFDRANHTGQQEISTITDLQDALDALNASVADPWSLLPIGTPVPLLDNLAGVSAPPSNKSYRYIKLTASDSYNTGVLTSESVSGSAPLVSATAVISLAGSPVNGLTVRLINTERRFLRAGSAGTVENDQMQQITGEYDSTLWGNGGAAVTNGAVTRSAAAAGNRPAPGSQSFNYNFTFDSANSPSARAGTETRSKNIGATYYMRIK